MALCTSVFFFFFNDTATTEIYTLSLHDALPICGDAGMGGAGHPGAAHRGRLARSEEHTSELQSHSFISYAAFCLKKKKKPQALCGDLAVPSPADPAQAAPER